MSDDFYKGQFFKRLREDIKEIKRRLNDLENAVFGGGKHAEKHSDLPSWYKDPNLMNFLKLVVIAIIVVVVAYVIITEDINILEVLL